MSFYWWGCELFRCCDCLHIIQKDFYLLVDIICAVVKWRFDYWILKLLWLISNDYWDFLCKSKLLQYLLWAVQTCYFESIATCKVLVVTEVHKFVFFEFSLWCSRHHCMILKWEFGITITVVFHNLNFFLT